MIIICRSCGHAFKRAHIVKPKALKPWDCPRKACKGYGTIETLYETLARSAKRFEAINSSRTGD